MSTLSNKPLTQSPRTGPWLTCLNTESCFAVLLCTTATCYFSWNAICIHDFAQSVSDSLPSLSLQMPVMWNKMGSDCHVSFHLLSRPSVSCEMYCCTVLNLLHNHFSHCVVFCQQCAHNSGSFRSSVPWPLEFSSAF